MSKRIRSPRRRTRDTLSRLNLAILTTPQSAAISVQSDIVLVRAAILYADQVELISPSAQMLAGLEAYGSAGKKDAVSLFASLDDETILRLGLPPNRLEMWHRLKGLLLDADSIGRLQRRLGPAGYDEFQKLLDGMKNSMESANTTMDEVIQSTLATSGYNEFKAAIELGILKLGDSRMVNDDSIAQAVGLALARQRGAEYQNSKTDDEVRLYTELLSRMVTDRSRMVLLDSGARELVEAMLAEGIIAPSLESKLRAQEAILGTGFISRLPVFAETRTDELLGLRDEFSAPLVRYRAAVGKMRDRLSTPYGRDVADEVDFIQRTEVEPALLEIREGFADHSWVRDTLRLNARDLVSFAAGSFGGNQLVQRLGEVGDLSSAVLAGLTAAGGGAAALTSGILRTSAVRGDLRRRDLYYLYEVGRRTQHR